MREISRERPRSLGPAPDVLEFLPSTGARAVARCGDVTALGRAPPASRCQERMREQYKEATLLPPRGASEHLGRAFCLFCGLKWIQKVFADRQNKLGLPHFPRWRRGVNFLQRSSLWESTTRTEDALDFGVEGYPSSC